MNRSIKIKKTLYEIYKKYEDLISKERSISLKKSQPEQINRFKENKAEFFEIYQSLKKYDIKKYLVPAWEENIKNLESRITQDLNFSFLRIPIIMNTMFAGYQRKRMKKRLDFLEKKYSRSELRFLLKEDSVGNPILLNSKYMTSHNTILSLYHFTNFLLKSKTKTQDIKTITEWGGGYGNLAKVINKKMTGITYLILDIPIFSCLQWIYLTTIFGKEKVNIIRSKKDSIEKGKINLVSLPFIDKLPKTDLFISIWALSESSKYSQDYVRNKDWFGAKNFLVVFQEKEKRFLYSEDIKIPLIEKGAITERMKFLPDCYYAIK